MFETSLHKQLKHDAPGRHTRHGIMTKIELNDPQKRPCDSSYDSNVHSLSPKRSEPRKTNVIDWCKATAPEASETMRN